MLQLRPARLDEPAVLALIEQVQAYYVELYGGRDDDPLDPPAFAPPHGGFRLALTGEPPTAVGMGGWSRGEHPTLGAAAVLRRMFVTPEARRQGVAAAVLTAVEDDARAAGLARAVLSTGSPQRAAVAFYRAHGYDDVPSFGYYAGRPGVVCLGREL